VDFVVYPCNEVWIAELIYVSVHSYLTRMIIFAQDTEFMLASNRINRAWMRHHCCFDYVL